MRTPLHDTAEKARLRGGDRTGTDYGEPRGAFLLRHPSGSWLWVLMSADPVEWAELGLPLPVWEHVSVSVRQGVMADGTSSPVPPRCPTHEELAWVKDLFWEPEECVIHYYPPRSRHMNNHPTTLHLWRPVGVDIPMPPQECV